ncbi:YhfG family protein [Endozoicomonas sp. 4G]|uniref:YhfG family protein n=1 Tax=Endozoicomonas sp. 4G TaxID=2872754 RepID=UPI002078BA40|nr:YhfG family protein [Endozoicomonas sp. 4G]
MNVNEILSASRIDELKKVGSYLEVKILIEEKIDNKLGVNGWKPLFYKIKAVKESVGLNKNKLISECDGDYLNKSKKKVSDILGFKVVAKNFNELKKKIDMIIVFFGSSTFDPYEHYEKTKLDKFKSSSRLEGIKIEFSNQDQTIEGVLAKYRR